MRTLTSFRPQHLLPLVAVAASIACGCGDAGMIPIHDGTASSEIVSSAIDDAGATVSYETTDCDQAHCTKSETPAIEVYVEPRSVILDFSNVDGPGEFAEGEFAGYVIEIPAEADLPILAARIDRDATTFDIDDDRLTYDETSIEINLAGLTYDSTGFVKIDLLAGALNPLRAGH